MSDETSPDAGALETPADLAQDNAVEGAEKPPVDGHEELTNRGVDRGVIIGQGLAEVSRWCLRILVIGLAVALLMWLLSTVWVGVFPVILALIVTTVLWPPTSWLRSRGVPPALAAVLVLLTSLAVFVGVLAAITPSLVDQSTDLADAASNGLADLQERLAQPPSTSTAARSTISWRTRGPGSPSGAARSPLVSTAGWPSSGGPS